MTTDSGHGMGAGAGADTEAIDTTLDRYARMVRRALGVPTALVTLVQDSRQVFPGAVGLPAEYQASRETPLSHSFCQHVVADQQPLVIADARVDDRLRDNLAIRDLAVVAYAGWPLVDGRGDIIGSVCAIDSRPRHWSAEDLDALADLAAACSAELVQRELREEAVGRATALSAASRISGVLLMLSERLATTVTVQDIAVAVEQVAQEQLGCLHAGMWLRRITDPTRVPPPRAPGPGERAEPLTLVEDAVPGWEQARSHAHLSVAADNPLGEALLIGDLLAFRTVAAQNERFPHLRSDVQVGEGRAFVPLGAADNVFGALALVWAEEHHLDQHDLVAISSLRSYIAQALQRALLLQDRAETALTLQRAMLTTLPPTGDTQLSARYLATAAREQVGGDWYDAVLAPDGALHLSVGDVVGHDIEAAAVMGQLRSMLRTLVWTHSEPASTTTPARLVERLDRAATDLDVRAMATLFHARVEHAPQNGSVEGRPGGRPGGHTLHWTNAGHPPPLLLLADGGVEVLVDRRLGDADWTELTDPLLGPFPHGSRRDQTATLPQGATLVLYTDGLVERRGENLEIGIDRARAALRRRHGASLDGLVDGLIADLVGATPDDDVVVLAVRLDAGARDGRAGQPEG